jgi:hypothetical protein
LGRCREKGEFRLYDVYECEGVEVEVRTVLVSGFVGGDRVGHG